MTLAEALVELRERVESDKAPTLTDTTLTRILSRTTRVRNFAQAAAYRRGQLIAPASVSLAAYQGPVYLVVSGGVSGGEPSWPTAPGTTALSGPVQFVYFGPADVYDLHEAAREGWKQKMGRASELIHSKEAGVDQDWQQIFDHCKQRWEACGPAAVVG